MPFFCSDREVQFTLFSNSSEFFHCVSEPDNIEEEPHVDGKTSLRKHSIFSLNYSRTPVTRTLKGDEKRFKLSGVRVIESKII